MPTSNTYKIENGCSFEEFVWSCAGCFGAMREMEPDSYHLEQMENGQVRLRKLMVMADEEIANATRKEYEKGIEENLIQDSQQKLKILRYETILEKVMAWNPPSKDHENLKDYMIKQIKESMPISHHNYVPTQNPKKWLEDKITLINDSIEYHKKEYEKEVENTKLRNLLVKQLLESIPLPQKDRHS